MLDAELQVVDSEVVDISENAAQSSAWFTLGRRGFSRDCNFFVHIEEASADADMDPVRFDLEATLDGGTTTFILSSIKAYGNTALSTKKILQAPIGLWDLRDEHQLASGTGSLQVRVTANYVDATGTDNFTYSAYIGSPASYMPGVGIL